MEECEELVWSAELDDIVSLFFVGQCEKSQKARVTKGQGHKRPGGYLHLTPSASFQGTVQSAEGMESQVKGNLSGT